MTPAASATHIVSNQGRTHKALYKRIFLSRPSRIVGIVLSVLLAAEFSYRVRELLAALLLFSVAFMVLVLTVIALAALGELAPQGMMFIGKMKERRLQTARSDNTPSFSTTGSGKSLVFFGSAVGVAPRNLSRPQDRES